LLKTNLELDDYNAAQVLATLYSADSTEHSKKKANSHIIAMPATRSPI